MTGSSKSVLRDLHAIFDHWENGFAESLHTTDLFATIRLYHAKHNSLVAINLLVNIHSELYRFYDNYIKPSANLPTEILFLEILIELVPVLSQDQVELWLRTYLKPAVDSANYDTRFVDCCGTFIRKITCDYLPSSDPELTERRRCIAERVMNHILDLYLGSQFSSFDIITLTPSHSERSSQEFSERLRFIKKNCRVLLTAFGCLHPLMFYTMCVPRFKLAATRLGIVTLLSTVIHSPQLAIDDLIDTELFGNFLHSLMYDINEKIVQSVLGLLVMLIPAAASQIHPYVTDLLLVYARLAGDLTLDPGNWDIIAQDPIKTDINHDPLLTLLYGLFPYTLTTFLQDPSNFVLTYPPVIVNASVVVKLVPNVNLERFQLHPNYLNPKTLAIENELENPIKWISTTGQPTREQISLACFGLLPNVANNPSISFANVQELLLTHEKLYNQRLNDTEETDTQETDTKEELEKKITINDATIVDYYQRELLLLKNELEFSDYIKDIYKSEYITINKTMKQMVRDANANASNATQLGVEATQLKHNYALLKAQYDTLSQEYIGYKKELSEKYIASETRQRELEDDNNVGKRHIMQLQKQLDYLQTVSDAKDVEINALCAQLKVLPTDASESPGPPVLAPDPPPPNDNGHGRGHDVHTAQMEMEIASQAETIKALQDQIQTHKINYDNMMKTHETKLSMSKNDMAYLTNTLSNSNEKKIQELSGVLLKYEKLLEEKNGQIAQLSMSRPISIPGSSSSSEGRASDTKYSDTKYSMDVYGTRQYSSSSADTIPFNTPPLQTGTMKSYSMMGLGRTPANPQAIPIIKGRGGYQKRSKKHM